jgi:ketosteroid isomerase-like protein
MKHLIVCALILLSIEATAQNKDEQAIKKILANQEAAWNEGRLDKFMIGYWNNDSLLFIGKNGPHYGYDNTLKNYQKSYTDTAIMGHFTSTVISLKQLSKEYYFVTGKWFLKRTLGNLSGYYTLLFQKIKGEWVIVADHSS